MLYSFKVLLNRRKSKKAKVISPSGKEIYLVDNMLVDQNDDEFEDSYGYEEVFYTIEDYEDIIKSYRTKYDRSKVIKLVRK